jgi:invasion protein IalB
MTPSTPTARRASVRTALAGAGLALSLAAWPAAAQQRPATPAQPPAQQQPPAAAAPAAVAPRQVTGTTTGWVKICQRLEGSEREGCLISQDVRLENGSFLASVTMREIQGENRRQLIVAVPLGMALQAGMLFRVDQERALPGKYGSCMVNGCIAAIEIGADVLQQMRTGQNAFVTVRNAQGVALDLTVPLATFARAYDGPATDARALAEQQQRLESELLRRAEEARQRLQEQGQGATPPAAPPATPRQ